MASPALHVGASATGAGGTESDAPDVEAHIIIPLVELRLYVQSDSDLESSWSAESSTSDGVHMRRTYVTGTGAVSSAHGSTPLVRLRLKDLRSHVTQAGVDQSIEMYLRHMCV